MSHDEQVAILHSLETIFSFFDFRTDDLDDVELEVVNQLIAPLGVVREELAIIRR